MKTVVGTCVSLGILVESKPAKEIEIKIDEGKYDQEIKEEKTETSSEKKAKLEGYFSDVHKKQEELIKQEQAEKEAEEEKKAEEGAEKPEEEGEAKPEEEKKEEKEEKEEKK